MQHQNFFSFGIRRTCNLSFLLLFVFFFLNKPAFAQAPRQKPLLRNAQLVFPNSPKALDSFLQLKQASLVLIQFENLPDAATKEQLSQRGIRIVKALSANTFIVHLQPQNEKFSSKEIQSVVPFKAAWKTAPRLVGVAGSKALQELFVSFMPGSTQEEVRQVARNLGGVYRNSFLASLGYFRLDIPGNQIAGLAANPEVLAIDEAAKNVPLNYQSQRALQVNIAHNPVNRGGLGLLGDGITLGVGDDVSGLYHIDTRERVINYNPNSYRNHGQHTNGTVGGAGTVDPSGEGFAPHAVLVDEIYDLIWQRTGPLFSAYNMTATNNSYANEVGKCASAGVYDVYAAALDSVALAYPDVLHVFASGNDGKMTCAPYPASFKTVTGGYQTSKNVLVVGNVNKAGLVNAESSRGPIVDGRLKPEIVAVGSSVYSTKGGDLYLSASGTSMACPQITGTAGLLQQRFKQKHSGVYPSSAFLKAILMNGATDMGNPGPDFTFGFGIANVLRSAAMIDSNWSYSGTISNGGNQNPISISVPPNTGQLKVMLYWHDLPASPASASQLINDLDLKVTDPNAVSHLPLVLNAAPSAVQVPAMEGADHLNNVEQVVINYPQSGSYSVNVSGFSVPSGPQNYTLVYDLVPKTIAITSPNDGESYAATGAINCYWSAPFGTAPFTAEFSTDNGVSWTVLSNVIPADARTTFWVISGTINSDQCRFRVTRNGTGESATSGTFILAAQPKLHLSTVQCPGYASLHWSPTPQAASYDVLRKIGFYLQKIASTSDTNYVVSGLSPDSMYYFSVQPVVAGIPAFRSIAVKRQPNTGTCAGSISDGDLALREISAPHTGRLLTSIALGSSETLSLKVQNMDDQPTASYQIAYQINGGSWVSQTLSGIASMASSTVNFTGLNLAAPGNYFIRAAITNLSKTDPVPANDTISTTIRQLKNDPVNLALGFLEDFEGMPRLNLMGDSMGFSANQHWDYAQSDDTGRLRSFVDNEVSIAGNRSLSMDMWVNARPVFNRLAGTFNLSGNTTGIDEVRLEFDYRIHGTPKSSDSNKVWVRGAENESWLPIFSYDTGIPTGMPLHSGTLSITDVLAKAGQNFSSATQVAFGQYDTSVIAQNDYGNGLTLDNIKLYKVLNDVGLTAVLSPTESGCMLGSNTPLTIRIANGVTTPVMQLALFYRYDNGPIESDTIPLLAGKATVDYTFRKRLNTGALGGHKLDIWMVAPNDSYSKNDSILNYQFRNQPIISGFPYLEDFENGDGYWYAAGKNSSWEFGTPASRKINKAASGTHAWKTTLAGDYNDNEYSYLYSPCIDISTLKNPMLSFSGAIEIENCGGQVCDAAWVEYAIGDSAWKKLVEADERTNWYSDTTFQVWKNQDDPRWKVSSILLPKTKEILRLRFVMNSDAGAGFEGIAVDDIHIFDKQYATYSGNATGPINVNFNSNTGDVPFLQNGRDILGSINLNGQNLSNASLSVYKQDGLFDRTSLQYFLPKSFVLQSPQIPADSVSARFYISDADVVAMLYAGGCEECSKARDAYALGITKYDNSDKNLENGTLADNLGGTYQFIPNRRIKWVPYDAGYYAELKLKSFSEIWFNDGGATNSFALTNPSLEFDAMKLNASSVLCSWKAKMDTGVVNYELQRAENPGQFSVISSINSIHDNAFNYTFTDVPASVSTQALYYRLHYTLTTGRDYYSPVRQIVWGGGNAAAQVHPNPTTDGNINIRWTTQPGMLMQVAVSDASGRVLFRNQATASGYLNESFFQLGNLAKGIYFVRIEIGGESFNSKLGLQ